MMNEITHGQAKQYMLADLDGLLTSAQRLDLETHLRACETCRAESQSYSTLTARLQTELHARWDAQDGPSEQVLKNIHTQSRRIKMSKQVDFAFNLLGGLAAVLVVGFIAISLISQFQKPETISNGIQTNIPASAPQPEDRLIAFTSAIENGNLDIYTMHPDGSGLTNLTNNPAQDMNPAWSPDGKRIAFQSDRNGFMQIFIMDANGSNFTQITLDSTAHYLPLGGNDMNSPWSPDGSKILFLHTNSRDETITLRSYNINSKEHTSLATGRILFNGISWSPDDEHVAFTSYLVNEQGEPRQTSIQVVNADGSNLVNLTESLPSYLTPELRSWSRDGQSIIFFAHGDGYYVYEAGLDGTLTEHLRGSGGALIDWQNGVSLLLEDEMPALTWLHDGVISSQQTCQAKDIYSTRSNQGHLFIGIQCLTAPGTWSLYFSKDDDYSAQKLLEPSLQAGDGVMFAQVWSPDDNYIAFNISSDSGEVVLFILNVEAAFTDSTMGPFRLDVGEILSSLAWQPMP